MGSHVVLWVGNGWLYRGHIAGKLKGIAQVVHLRAGGFITGPDSPPNLCESAILNECSKIKADLLALVDQLKAWRQITGQLLTLEELVDLKDKWEIRQSLDAVELGDLEIVQMVYASRGGLSKR